MSKWKYASEGEELQRKCLKKVKASVAIDK